MENVIIFITGMSGTGKSAVLERLADKGYKTIDTDYGRLSVNVCNSEQGESEWLWDEEKVKKIVTEHQKGALFISGTVANQGKFYAYFDEVVYFSAPLKTILDRVQKRTTNPYGKSEQERKEIIDNFERYGTVIEASATKTIDTTKSLDEVTDDIEELALSYLH